MQSVMEQDDGKKIYEHDKAIVIGKSYANWGKEKAVFPYILGMEKKLIQISMFTEITYGIENLYMAYL